MCGVITHVSTPKISTACTTALENIPNALGLTPSLRYIINRRAHLLLTFRIFPTTASQLLYKSVMICPKYFNDVTVSIRLLQAWKALAVLSLISSAVRQLCF